MYTREEVIGMVAGRELDRAIALHVMGYEPSQVKPDMVRKGAKATYPLPYSDHIATAWDTVEKLLEHHCYAEVYANDGGYEVIVRRIVEKAEDCMITADVEAETAPLAICRAALLSLLKED